MKIPQLKETFFGRDLRKGSVFLAWVSIVTGVICLSIAALGYYDIMENYENRYRTMYVYGKLDLDDDDYRRMYRMKSERIIEAICGILASVAGIAVSTLLLVGINKRKPGLMLPSIITMGVGLALLSFTAFQEAFSHSGINRDVFQMIVYGSILYYCFLVLYGHYRELKEVNISDNILSHQILSHESIMTKDSPMKPTINNIA